MLHSKIINNLVNKFLKNNIIQLLIVFLIIFFLKYYKTQKTTTPTVFADETVYADTAYRIWTQFKFVSDITNATTYPPLYSLFLAPTYIFKNMRIAFFVQLLINNILTTLILFPIYIILKEINDKKKGLIFEAAAITILPSILCYNNLIMSENPIFFPVACKASIAADSSFNLYL